MKQFSKILSLGILFLFVCTLQLSAQKCKFDYNKTDPITGESTKGNTQKGDPIVFKLSNGEVITVSALDEFLPTAQATQNGIITVYQGKYRIDAATLQKIAESAPTFVRMNIESKVYEKEINAKTGKQISEAATCILQ